MKHEQALTRLAKLLKRGPMTARAIAQATDCCKPVAYARIRALQERGFSLYSVRASDGSARRGPKALAWGIL